MVMVGVSKDSWPGKPGNQAGSIKWTLLSIFVFCIGAETHCSTKCTKQHLKGSLQLKSYVSKLAKLKLAGTLTQFHDQCGVC